MKQKSRTRRSLSPEQTVVVARMFKRLMKSTTMDKESAKRFARLSRSLSSTFRGVCPNVNPKLRGTLVALLLDVVNGSDKIKKDVQKLTRLKRPKDAQTLGSVLKDLQLLRLESQQQYIAQLSRSIPTLLRSIKKREGMQSPRKGLVDELTDLLDSCE
jgi:hypothetical protein